MAQSTIRFLLNNRAMTVGDVAPTTSVLEYLRQRTGCMGTKEGCAEGDCGACTVVIGERRHGEIVMKTVNACIRFLPTLQGKALFTVEYLRGENGHLHPVQQAMVDCHASQCGFCTPGFVMSLWGLYANGAGSKNANESDETSVRRAITGNLCRCTGYRPIIEAGKRMFDMPTIHFDRIALAQMLASLAQTQTTETTCFENQGRRFYTPRTLAELIKLRAAFPESTILAGGTDIGLWVNKQFRELGDIVYTGEVAELRAITEDAVEMAIGAAVSLSDTHATLRRHYPEMNELWERFASMPIRNAGTLGGNIANGSPIGDAMPALMVLGARVTLRNAARSRQMPLEELYVGYQRLAILPDEILVSIHIPKPTPRLRFRVYKLSKRFDSDISALCAAFAIEMDGASIRKIRIAYGGMAAIPKRASRTEANMLGKTWDEATLNLAMMSLSQDFAPLTDLRASTDYRMNAARNLVRRFHLETRPVNPIAMEQTSVFAGNSA